MRKFFYIAGGLLFTILLVFGFLSYYFIFRPLPTTEGTIELAGFSAPVKVFRDRWGVPHLYAETEHDLLFAQGFVQAQDRMWQMEANRRLAAGRLSEMIGEDALDLDRLLRTLGFVRAAAREIAAADPHSRALLEAFSAGVNAYLQRHRGNLPLEFRVLGVDPEPWRPVDSLAWGKFMAFMGGKNWQEELVRAMLANKLGAGRAAELLNRIGSAAPSAAISGSAVSWSDPAPAALAWTPAGGGGSNNWVVHGSKTASGAPLLANDMHLPLRVPSIWYEMHLNGGGLDVIGLSLAGVPLIVAGHNPDVAWGITFAYIDNQDLYVEHLDPTDSGRYRYRDKWLRAASIQEPIRVKGRAEPVIHRVWETRHGPILNLAGEKIDGRSQALAIRWTAHDPGNMMENLYPMNRASSAEEFCAAASRWTEPAVNFVFADTGGTVGYALGARVPIRELGHGRGPFAGWRGENEWKGTVPSQEMPHFQNPENGFVATANNPIRIDGFGTYLSDDFAPGYRAARIEQVLAETEKASASTFRDLQADLFCPPAGPFLDAIRDFKARSAAAKRLMELLLSWDRRLGPESVGGAVYMVLFHRLLENTFRDDLEDLTERFFGVGLTAVQPLNRFSGHSRVILHSLMQEPGSPWFDDIRTPERETLGIVLEKSLEETAVFLEQRLGKDPASWQWGRLHQVEMAHPLGRVKPLNRIFNIGPFPGDGHFSTVAQSSVMPGMDFSLNGWAVSNRHIFDPKDWDRSLASIVPGQSGMLGSRHYRDQVDLWKKVDHHPLYFSREKVEKEAKQVLNLIPPSQ
ncbi:MAG: penicillin acylase family protein [Desulfobacterales bacterium]|nr:penicillin acylase family protein [Desulfobacterales bacterium]